MITRCSAVGVNVYADVVFNQVRLNKLFELERLFPTFSLISSVPVAVE